MLIDERKFIVLAAVLILILGVLGWWFFWPKGVKQIVASGTIEATEVEVSSKVGGTIVKLKVSEGDKVSKGDILAEIDKSELYALYKQAKGAEEQAKAGLDLARKNFERSETLFADGFVSQQVLDQAKANFDAALAAYEQAKAARELANIRLRDSTIASPISGYVIVKSVEMGELVNPGSPIVTIADLSKVYINVYVSEQMVGKINLGNEVLIFVDSYPKNKFIGKVVYISQQAEFTPKTIQTKEERVMQVFAVKVEVSNPELKLKPGLPADAVIKI